MCSKKEDLREDRQYEQTKVGDIDSLFGKKRNMFKLVRNVNGTGFTPDSSRVKLTRVRPGDSLCSVNRAIDTMAETASFTIECHETRAKL